jgi:hypothetical protein
LRIISFRDHVARELDRVSYAPQRLWLRRITLALVILTILAVLAALLVGQVWWLALVLGAAALLSGAALGYFEWAYRRRSQLRDQLQAGLKGQRILPRMLVGLDDNYYLLNNFNLPGRADDIDHLVIGPNGIFALETKHHRGRIFWRDGEWYQSKVSRRGRLQPETPMRDPTQQLKRNVDYLRSCINRTDPMLSHRTRLWIEGAVVFTHPAVSLDLPEAVLAALPFPVLRARNLPAHILGHVPRQSYSKADVRQIISMLGHLQPAYPAQNR